MGYQGWDQILMITLIFSKKAIYKIMSNTVSWINHGTLLVSDRKSGIGIGAEIFFSETETFFSSKFSKNFKKFPVFLLPRGI